LQKLFCISCFIWINNIEIYIKWNWRLWMNNYRSKRNWRKYLKESGEDSEGNIEIDDLKELREKMGLGKSNEFMKKWKGEREKWKKPTLRFEGVAEYADQRARNRSCASFVAEEDDGFAIFSLSLSHSNLELFSTEVVTRFFSLLLHFFSLNMFLVYKIETFKLLFLLVY